jgi:lipopolysaccharide heptosyltransferase II
VWTPDLLCPLSIRAEDSFQHFLRAFRLSFPLLSRLRGTYQKSANGNDAGDHNLAPPSAWFDIDRVLVKEVNWLGDLVMSLPALREVRRTFSAAKLSVLIRQDLVGFFDGMNWVDEVIPYVSRAGLRGLADQQRIIAAVRARRFDLAVIFPNSFRSALWMSLAGVPRRAGYAIDGRRFLLSDRATPSSSAQERHQSFYWLGMVRDTLRISLASTESASERLELSSQSVARMREFLAARRRNRDAPLIAISPIAAYGPAKEWPLQRYAELIDLVDKLAGAECLLLGTTSDRPKCEQLVAMGRSGAIVVAGQTDVGELKALLSLCDGFAGNDSGAMHLAAAIGVPTVGIFGSTNPLRTGPVGLRSMTIYHPVECSPCLQRTCRFGHYRCLQAVSPIEVAQALAQLGAFAKARPAAFRESS